MSANIAPELQSEIERTESRTLRARVVLALGPLTSFGGLVWAVVQPWRLTLLHPHGQGFWWLLSEPPLFVVLVGVAFRFLLAPGLADDLERDA
ncbi:MAG TPA: hypothetical protein VMU58_09075 [Gaiellaceae bacterium]|nr:hypothetical protein [Gaiellaceae bacterium]